jgi:D-tyrosyl-tRNA(Tyr) deacylase
VRAVVQRVSRAEVRVDGEVVGKIARGLCILLGAGKGDTDADEEYLVEKMLNLRIFEDADRKKNLSLLETKGEALVVSQFTLLGDARKGRRPSFIDALEPEEARRRYESVCARMRAQGVLVETGRFAAMMEVDLVNWGPVTILLDSKRLF